MRKFWHIVFGLAASLLVVSVLAWIVPAAEPAWQGKRLGEWLKDIKQGAWTSENQLSPAERQAVKAIRAMDQRALPYLLKELEAGDTWFCRWCQNTLTKYKFFRYKPKPTYERRWAGMRGLMALGPRAEPALPVISRLFAENKLSCQGPRLMAALGPKALPALTELLDHTNAVVRLRAAYAIPMAGGANVPAARLALRAHLDDPAESVRLAATNALKKMKSPPE